MQSKVYKYKNLEFFAEDGVIHMKHKDPQTGEPFEKTELISTMKERVNALRAVADKFYLKYSLVPAERDAYESADKFLKICQDLIRDAEDQGDPGNKAILAGKLFDANLNDKYVVKK